MELLEAMGLLHVVFVLKCSKITVEHTQTWWSRKKKNKKKWVTNTKVYQDQVEFLGNQCGEKYGNNFKHGSRNQSFELVTTNAESFKTGLLNSEKHNITSKQSPSFSDSALPVDYQFSAAPGQDLQSSYGEVHETATNKGFLCQEKSLEVKSCLQKN